MSNRFQIEIMRDWGSFEPRWQRVTDAGRGSPFQKAEWLRLWYSTFAGQSGVTPLLIACRDASADQDALLLPLIERRKGPLSFIEFADLDVCDCNAPALGTAAPVDHETAAVFWRELKSALPACDAIRFAKMPRTVAGRPNPLALLPDVQTSPLRTWALHVDGSWEEYLRSLDRSYRKELGRSLRLFEAAGTGRFVRATTEHEANRILSVIDDLQRTRLDERNSKHIFEKPAHQRFYTELATRGLQSGLALVTGLELNGEIVAGCLAVVDYPRVTLVRIANRGGELARIGLGRLVIERTMSMMHAEGFSILDFSIGDGTHKSRFAAQPEALAELRQYCSWRGRAYQSALHAKRIVKTMPVAERFMRAFNRSGSVAA